MEKRRARVSWRGVWLALGLLVALCAWSPQAQAQTIRDPYGGSRPLVLDAPMLGFTYFGVGGVIGARFGIPIVHNGFVPSINNAVYINFGVDFYYVGYSRGYGFGIGIPIMLHWEFYFTPRWSAFAELGVNIFLDEDLFGGGAFVFVPARWIGGAVGGKFHISDRFALVLRLGSPYSSFGLSWSF